MSEQVLEWTAHPLYGIPTREQCVAAGPEWTLAMWRMREEAIALEVGDPYRHGYEPPVWALADEQLAELRRRFPVGVIQLMVFGGNRAGKSEWAAKRVVQGLVRKAKSKWWCLQSTESSSVQNQQALIWKYLPAEWKPTDTGKMRKGAVMNITFTQKGGFTENTFVLPNGSQCWFKFYSMDVGSVEGAELDGAWLDELYTPEWLEALRYRCLTRNGMIIKTFTPVQGYTAAVKEELSGAKTLVEVDAELLPVFGKVEMGTLRGGRDLRDEGDARDPDGRNGPDGLADWMLDKGTMML